MKNLKTMPSLTWQFLANRTFKSPVSLNAFNLNVSIFFKTAINNVQILGRVGAHPQKRGNDEHPVVVFSLATNSSYRYETGDVSQKTEWHRVCVFKPTLRDMILNYMKKGNRVLVNGRLMYGSFTGEDGSLKNSTSIVADDIIFFQGKQELAP